MRNLIFLIIAVADLSCSPTEISSSSLQQATSASDRNGNLYNVRNGQNILSDLKIEHLTSNTKPQGQYAVIYNDLPDGLSRDEQISVYGRADTKPDCIFDKDRPDWKPSPGSDEFNCLQAYYSITNALKLYETYGFIAETPMKVLINFHKDETGEEFVDGARYNFSAKRFEFGLSVERFPLMRFNEIVIHEITHYVYGSLVDTSVNSGRYAGVFFEGIPDVLADLFTGINKLGLGTKIENQSLFDRDVFNREFFARSNAAVHEVHLPMLASMAEFRKYLDEQADLTNAQEPMIRTVMKTITELGPNDSYPSFFEKFLAILSQESQYKPEWALKMRQILAAKGLANNGYTSGILFENDFECGLDCGTEFKQLKLNQTQSLGFTIQSDVSSDGRTKFPVKMYIVAMTADEKSRFSSCLKAQNNADCFGEVLTDSPYQDSSLYLSTRKLMFAGAREDHCPGNAQHPDDAHASLRIPGLA